MGFKSGAVIDNYAGRRRQAAIMRSRLRTCSSHNPYGRMMSVESENSLSTAASHPSLSSVSPRPSADSSVSRRRTRLVGCPLSVRADRCVISAV